jgi:hypothetical protein
MHSPRSMQRQEEISSSLLGLKRYVLNVHTRQGLSRAGQSALRLRPSVPDSMVGASAGKTLIQGCPAYRD